MSQIEVLVLSDSILLRDALCSLLLPYEDLDVIGASGIQEALTTAQRQQPDVLLLDISGLATGGRQVLHDLHATLPQLGVIVLTYRDRCNPSAVMSMLERGIRGILCGQEDAAELANAIRTIAAGDVYLCPIASGILLRSYRTHVGSTARKNQTAGSQ